MRAVIHIIGLLALGAACSDDAGPAPEVELGTGTTEFEPLTDGQELEVIRGPQGGFHFHVHARMSGIEPGSPDMPGLLSNPRTSFAAFLEGGDQIDLMFPPYRLGYVDLGGGDYELPSGRILQILEESVPAIYGQRVRLTVSVEDDAGRQASTEVTVLAVEQADASNADAGPDAGSE